MKLCQGRLATSLLGTTKQYWRALRPSLARFARLNAPFPGRYHRLGTFIVESRKRFEEKYLKDVLLQERIDTTRAWRAEQIATLYTYDQAAAFPSLRAILKTLPAKQPREKNPKGGDNGRGAMPQKPHQDLPTVANNEEILDRFVALGIEVKEQFGNDALDQALEQIRAHIPETLEDAFARI